MRSWFLVIAMAFAAWPAQAFQAGGVSAAAASDLVDIRELWVGPDTMPADSLFEAHLAYREALAFTVEPALPGESLPDLLRRVRLTPEDADLVAATFFTEAGIDALPDQTSVRLKFSDLNVTVEQLASGGYFQGLEEMEILVPPNRVVSLRREGTGFAASTRLVDIERRFVAAAGEINVSLFASAIGAGVPRDLMIRFADIFAFDVDFSRDIHRGDRFELVYEMRFDQEGREVAPGDILFAAMSWQSGSKQRRYYLFAPEGEDGRYFDDDGRNPRTQLMKTPINGARITSGFGRRTHPILGYRKDHRGVDFAAPRGTPIMATGDGEVALSGPRGSLGNYIRLRHTGGYETAYAHLDRIAPSVTPGSQVKQGQVIGYVGSTGRSTGPHLHYEVLFEGQQQNPQTVKVAVGETLIGPQKSRFIVSRDKADRLRVVPFAVTESVVP
ncbi:MAG: M23 family metallopeptidase [Pseudomonadota bacterium]